jgi:hypothetical protein
MWRPFSVLFALIALALMGASCNGTTGDQLISFSAFARGTDGAAKAFTTYDASGNPAYSVQLLRASMYVGALYFDESPPSTGFDTPECITPDIYAAQVPGGLEIDLLSTAPQAFSAPGNGSADVALSWDLWLTNGDINGPNLGVHIIDLLGVATRLSDHAPFAFGAIVTINPVTGDVAGARLTPVTNDDLPGQYPICKDRILAIGLASPLAFFQGGTLNVTIDPRVWFNNPIDFANALDTFDSNDCQLDANANATYENGNACGAGGKCDDGFVCNSDDNHCIAQFCIPDTNFGLGQGAAAGQDFFSSIQGGGTPAYGVSYSSSEAP